MPQTDELSIATEVSKSKERPLASRRNLINKANASKSERVEKTDDDLLESPEITKIDNVVKVSSKNDETEPDKKDLDKGKPVKLEEKEAKDSAIPNKINNDDSNNDNESKNNNKSGVNYTKKSLKEIELEVAENTAKFDATVLKKDDKQDQKKKISVSMFPVPEWVGRVIKKMSVIK